MKDLTNLTTNELQYCLLNIGYANKPRLRILKEKNYIAEVRREYYNIAEYNPDVKWQFLTHIAIEEDYYTKKYNISDHVTFRGRSFNRSE